MTDRRRASQRLARKGRPRVRRAAVRWYMAGRTTERVEPGARRSAGSMRVDKGPSRPEARAARWLPRQRPLPRRPRCTCTRDDRASVPWSAHGWHGLFRRSPRRDASAARPAPQHSPRQARRASDTAATPPALPQRAGTRRRDSSPARGTTTCVALSNDNGAEPENVPGRSREPGPVGGAAAWGRYCRPAAER